jgi:hypothetical protein
MNTMECTDLYGKPAWDDRGQSGSMCGRNGGQVGLVRIFWREK